MAKGVLGADWLGVLPPRKPGLLNCCWGLNCWSVGDAKFVMGRDAKSCLGPVGGCLKTAVCPVAFSLGMRGIASTFVVVLADNCSEDCATIAFRSR